MDDGRCTDRFSSGGRCIPCRLVCFQSDTNLLNISFNIYNKLAPFQSPLPLASLRLQIVSCLILIQSLFSPKWWWCYRGYRSSTFPLDKHHLPVYSQRLLQRSNVAAKASHAKALHSTGMKWNKRHWYSSFTWSCTSVVNWVLLSVILD
jgi:hypothetical protein